MINTESNFPRIFNQSKSHYMELHPKEKLVYVYQSQGNLLIEVYSIDELKQEIKNRS
ncbi:hypothetical protein QIT55_gp45 [Nitrosopumilus spindle-shaped virus]|uniref:Uncharacterized protein n=1 Tax=Nitrosopumilus spindle-shaped virus 1 TaxID=2848002 RepID=A0A514K327_9VIRU|nr:hypothetical protein QIT55_gp45 [Nitrosopumilus spindle-shaped virus]QDI74031.1 hypothetical protein [Nitrosopumilus spindle-shaped virus]